MSSYSGFKRKHDEISTEHQFLNKRARIVNQMLDGINNYSIKQGTDYDTIIINLDIKAKVKEYDVHIFKNDKNIFEYRCSCCINPFINFKSNYCKHFGFVFKKLIKDYLCTNEKFFKDKQLEALFQENIEFLKSSIKDLNIKCHNEKSPFSK